MIDSDLAILNRNVMVELIGDDESLIKQFEMEFLRQAKLSLGKIVTLYNQSEIRAIKEEAHFLKTSAKAVGAEQTAELLQQLEVLSLDSNKPECKKVIVNISESVKKVYGEIANGG